MTEEKIAKIRELSKVYLQKRMCFDAHGLLNTYGKTPDEVVKMSQDAHVAEAEMLEAHAALRAAQQP